MFVWQSSCDTRPHVTTAAISSMYGMVLFIKLNALVEELGDLCGQPRVQGNAIMLVHL